AEDGIRDWSVTGVQTCALPISALTGTIGGTAWLWDAATGRPLLDRPLRHPGLVASAAFSPDGKTLVTGCYDGMARLWETASGRGIGRAAGRGRGEERGGGGER